MATMLAPPHPRLGRPEDIAALVVFLACDKSAFITGQNICVDGGLLAHQPFAADFRTDIRYSAVRGAAAAAVAGDLRAQPEAVVLAVGGEQRQDRGELFCRTDPAHGLADPGSGGQAGAGRNGDACPGGDGRVGSRQYPGGLAQAPSASEGMSRKPPANSQNR